MESRDGRGNCEDLVGLGGEGSGGSDGGRVGNIGGRNWGGN